MDIKEQTAKLRENVPPSMVDAYDRIVAAGMKFMFDKRTHQMSVDVLKQEGPIDEKLAAGIGQLMLMLFKQSNNTMPQHLIIPAGIDLLLQAADFAQQTGLAEVTPQEIASAIQKFVFYMAKSAGVEEEELMAGMGKLQQMGGQQAESPMEAQNGPA